MEVLEVATEIGSKVPDFTLPSTTGQDVSLSQMAGQKVLIAFFPLAFTPG